MSQATASAFAPAASIARDSCGAVLLAAREDRDVGAEPRELDRDGLAEPRAATCYGDGLPGVSAGGKRVRAEGRRFGQAHRVLRLQGGRSIFAARPAPLRFCGARSPMLRVPQNRRICVRRRPHDRDRHARNPLSHRAARRRRHVESSRGEERAHDGHEARAAARGPGARRNRRRWLRAAHRRGLGVLRGRRHQAHGERGASAVARGPQAPAALGARDSARAASAREADDRRVAWTRGRRGLRARARLRSAPDGRERVHHHGLRAPRPLGRLRRELVPDPTVQAPRARAS